MDFSALARAHDANLAADGARASSTTGRTGRIGRRSFIKLAGAATGGSVFALGVATPTALHAQGNGAAAAGLKPSQMPGPFVAIAADGSVTVQVNRLDFGQGVATTLPMLVAEEMDADWSRVRGALAPAGAAYADPVFGMQMTGGSSAVKNSWQQYREIGARARAMLVAAAAQQWGVDAASVSVADGVLTAPGGKRAGFSELAAAAMQLPVPEKVTLKPATAYKLLGKDRLRNNTPDIVRGRQAYGVDFGLDAATKPLVPGLKVVLVARPPVFGGKIAKFDAAAARAVKGVQAVLEVDTDRGGRGVAVVADGYWAAKQGRDALNPQWSDAGVEKIDSAALLARYRELAAQDGLAVKREGAPTGPQRQRLAAPAQTIAAEYRFPYLAHAPMEPLNCTIAFDGSRAQVWAGTQFQTVDQGAVAATLGLKPEQVTVNTLMAGGGFGRRAVPTSDYLVEAAQVAKAWRASGRSEPLKVMWSREDDIRGGYYRPAQLHTAQIGIAADGTVQSWRHHIVGQSILKGTPFEAFMVKDGVDATGVEGVADTGYKLPLDVRVTHPQLNVPVLWWRSVGHTHTAFVMETLIDEIASATKQDPVALRTKLWDGKHPRHQAALELAVARSGYGQRKLAAGRAYGVAVHESFDSVVAYVVEASMQGKAPRLHRVTAGVHCNFAVNPLNVQAQVQGAVVMGLSMCLAGEAITLKDGRVEQGNFGDYTVARLPQAPVVDVHIVPSTEPPTGMGEPGLPALAPAFANALFKLTGKRQRELPFVFA